MTLKSIVVSDISGSDIPDDRVARIVVSDHPALDGRVVELDADVTEAESLEGAQLSTVSLAVYLPNESAARHIVMDVVAFESHFADDVEGVLQRARPGEAVSGQGGRGAGGLVSRPGRIDYTDVDHFGQLHPGRVTAREAELVRDNLDQANKNRAVLGQKAIDLADERERARYHLD